MRSSISKRNIDSIIARLVAGQRNISKNLSKIGGELEHCVDLKCRPYAQDQFSESYRFAIDQDSNYWQNLYMSMNDLVNLLNKRVVLQQTRRYNILLLDKH